ncbi:Oidioi.mRNA.OKI2018_I69.chr1.g522.t1.cds [Oikopleura dioica]|uniref:Oidioi.mRNA.OKI2018_I69.chr1.g522.t1.cds n=1 Tax=Oikopleura dioica TaxID=34765 RepID=A0ABN7SK40_OIKDI|nr:Oidioi.mRNA.OKI2018_I69.chr1.g522.t1.cds [Oikopleura dioica]
MVATEGKYWSLTQLEKRESAPIFEEEKMPRMMMGNALVIKTARANRQAVKPMSAFRRTPAEEDTDPDPWVDELINEIGNQQKEEEEMREKERKRVKQDERRSRRQVSYEPDVPISGEQPEISVFHPVSRKDNPSMNSSSGFQNKRVVKTTTIFGIDCMKDRTTHIEEYAY